MSVQKTKTPVKNQSETSDLMKTLESHISKPEVKKILIYPGMAEKMVSSGVQGILDLYQNSGEANKAISTVLVDTAYHSILKEKVSGRPNGDLERKIILYSNSTITEYCNDAIVVGVEKMAYGINTLHTALGGDIELTLKVLELIGEMKSAHDIAIGLTTILSINERVRDAKGQDFLQVAKECIQNMSEFKKLAEKLSKIN